jgi:hypothetical protein
MRSRKHTGAACAISLALALGLAACGSEHDLGVEEPAREGLALDIGGVEYNIFITRELNLAITPDEAYYEGPAAEPGHALYGVFLRACNPEDASGPVMSASEFTVTDNQGTEFEPLELPEDNAFAYQSRELAPGECIPKSGSVAQQGPTAGSMLIFDFPLSNTENRPLELEVTSPAGEGDPETKRFHLDL